MAALAAGRLICEGSRSGITGGDAGTKTYHDTELTTRNITRYILCYKLRPGHWLNLTTHEFNNSSFSPLASGPALWTTCKSSLSIRIPQVLM
jgi:hypothetical protein